MKIALQIFIKGLDKENRVGIGCLLVLAKLCLFGTHVWPGSFTVSATDGVPLRHQLPTS